MQKELRSSFGNTTIFLVGHAVPWCYLAQEPLPITSRTTTRYPLTKWRPLALCAHITGMTVLLTASYGNNNTEYGTTSCYE